MDGRLTEDEKLEIVGRWKDAKRGLADFKAGARKSFDFVASRQWEDQDFAQLREEERPALTFNRTEVFVDAIVGNEINSRQTVKYFPRGMEPDLKVSELMNGAVKWVRDGCNAPQEESDAFRDAIICGIGVTETRMDYEEDPEGRIIEERKDPLMYWWDPSSKKQCLEDRRYDFYAEWVDKKIAKEYWPEAEFTETRIWDDDQQPHDGDANTWYEKESPSEIDRKDQVLIVKYECFKRVPFYKVEDPESGKILEVEYSKYKKIAKAYEKNGQSLNSVRMHKKVFYRAFLAGEEVLEYTKSPIQRFSRQPITGKRDRNRNSWYGVVRVMMDPQKWANKFLSSILNIIGQNAKGGVFFESNVFVDQRKAEDDWAKPAPMIEVTEGSIAQGRIRERVAPPIPSGLERLMMFSFDSMPFVTGINLEALGLADRQQAGVLEAQRRRAAFGILAPLFESLRRYRKNQGQVLIEFVKEFISDGRLVRIIGDTGDTKYVPLVKDRMTLDYDINVDESPDSPDFKEKTWEVLQNMIPTMLKIGYPVPPEIWSFSPLPSTVSQAWIEAIKKGPQIPEQVKQQMAELQNSAKKLTEKVGQLSEENAKLKIDSTVDILKITAQRDAKQAQIAQKAQDSQVSHSLEMLKILIESKDKNREINLKKLETLMSTVGANFESRMKALSDEKKQALEKIELAMAMKEKALKQEMLSTVDSKLMETVKKVGKKPVSRKIKRTSDGFEIEEKYDDGVRKKKAKRTADGYEIN